MKAKNPAAPGAGETVLDREIESDGSTPIAIDLAIP